MTMLVNRISTKPIITCAITGHATTLKMAPVPITPQEQALAAKLAVEAGASIIHLHVREDNGAISLRSERYYEAISLIKKQIPEVILEISMRGIDSAPSLPELVERGNLALIDNSMWGNDPALKPDLCALNISTRGINEKTILINSLNEIQRQIEKIYELGVIPRCDLYDIGDIRLMNRLIESGILKTPVNVLLIFGGYSGIGASEQEFNFMISQLPNDCYWTALGAGKYNFSIADLAINYSGGLRTGFEDTTYISQGVKATSNAQLVDKLTLLCRTKNCIPASITEARQFLINY